MQRFRFLSPSPTPADTLSHSRGDFPGTMQVTKDTRYIRSDVTWAHAHLICWWWRWVWLGVRIPCWYWPGSGTGRWFQNAAVWSCDVTCSTVTTPELAAAATALTGRTNARYCSWPRDSRKEDSTAETNLLYIGTVHYKIQRCKRVCAFDTHKHIKHSGIGIRHWQHYLILGYNAVRLQRLFPLQWDPILWRSRSHKLLGNRTGHYSTDTQTRREMNTQPAASARE